MLMQHIEKGDLAEATCVLFHHGDEKTDGQVSG